MRLRLVWVVAGIAAAAVITLALSLTSSDPYPMPADQGSSRSDPATIGAPTQAVVLFLEPRPGDRFELLGAEAVGLVGARTALYLSRPVINAVGDRVIGEVLEPIAGAVIEAPAGASPGPEHAVGIVAELTPDQAGIFELTAIRLRYRINGGAEQAREGISVLWTVCADDPAPTTCE
jgi:hypothetical protein